MKVRMQKISFVIPCYNSEASLASTVREIVIVCESLTGYSYEIVLVNDGSKDNTFNVIEKLCSSNKKIKGINLSKNFGQANATLAGLGNVSGDFIVYSDDDGQTPVDELEKLLDKMHEGFDVVFARFSEKKNSYFQNFGTSLNNFMAKILIGKPDHLHMGNFWVSRKFIIDEIIKNSNPFPYIGGLFLKTTANIGQVPTSHRKRQTGNSNYTLKKMISLWLNGFTAFSVMPLRGAAIIGFLNASVGFVYAIYIIISKIIYPNIPVGYSSIMSAILFIGGMIMFMLGLIGEYVGRIYLNINKIPQYVIKEKMNS